MKKVGVLFVLLSALSFSATASKSARQVTVDAKFNQLEAEYEKLVNMENQEYNKLKTNADAAAAKLAQLEAQKDQILEKISKIKSASNSRELRSQYSELERGYEAVVKKLDIEIKSLKTTVDNFAAIENLKGSN